MTLYPAPAPQYVGPVDVLAIAAHPDDVELGAGGTLLKLKAQGYRTGIADLTRGELGTRGTAETRTQEATEAARVLGLDVRVNLDLPDGFFQNIPEHQLVVIRAIRAMQPSIVITNAWEDRHPDHGKGAALVRDACFLAGLRRIETEWNGEAQAVHRPKRILHLIQDRFLEPTLIVDVSEFWETKMQAVLAYGTQFHNPNRPTNEEEPETHISTADFLHFLDSRGREFGHQIGARYGEGFQTLLPLPVDDVVVELG